MQDIKRVQSFRGMDGVAYQLRATKLVFKRREDEAGNAYSLIELVEPPGGSVALHRHAAWQETFIVLEGRFDFQASGEHHALGPGEIIVIPRGAPHGYTCTSPEPGRLLTISDPARVFEDFAADTQAANNDPARDVGAVFESHAFELL